MASRWYWNLVEVNLTLQEAIPHREAATLTRKLSNMDSPPTQSRSLEHELAELRAGARHRAIVLETANRVALDILASRSGVEALRHIADAARTLAGARYAALGVARPEGGLAEFITVGLTQEQEARIGQRPRGEGVLGLLLHRDKPLRINVLSEHPASAGFPEGHPPMTSFLGVPIRRGAEVLGSLYLTDKEGGDSFTEADEVAVEALGAHAAVAIHHIHLLTRQRSLAAALLTAQEEERRAVAADLHDGLTQFVMAAHAHLGSYKVAADGGKTERAQAEWERGITYLKEAVVESRRLVSGLRSLALDDLGLLGAIQQLLLEERARAGWKSAELEHNLADQRFDRMIEVAAYRVAQEALSNIRKHAETDTVEISLRFTSNDLCLKISDQGQGFDLQTVLPPPGARLEHFGLPGMAERASLVGGTFKLESAPDEGTVVEAHFPVSSE